MMHFILAIMGCDQSEKQIQEEDITEDEQYILSLQIDTDSTIAGQDVSYEVILVDQNQEILELSSWSIQSSVEANLFWTMDKFKPTVATEHELSIVATHYGVDYVANNTIIVEPSTVFIVDLQTDSYTARAGENISFQTLVEDRFGNQINNVDIDLSTSNSNLVIQNDQINSTVADVYTVSASYGSVGDEEVIQITPNVPIDIELAVPNNDIELNESAHCAVLITDQYGNETDDPWTLWTDGSGLTTVSFDSITFLEEGEYTIYAQVDDTNLIDSFGPFIVDSSGPTIDITSPNRGEWTNASSTTVTGTITEEFTELTGVTINANPISIDTSGGFSETLSNDFGINIIETEAQDSDGNTSSDTRSVLSGSYWSEGSGIDDSINVYIGSAGMQTMEDYAHTTLAGINLSDFLPSNPVAQQNVLGCTASINLYNASYSTTDLDINPNSDGTITITFTLYDMYVYADVPLTGGSWWNPCPDFSGDIDASSIVATVIVEPYISNNQLYVDITSSSATINGLDVDLDGWTSILNFVVNFFEDDLSEMLEEELISAVEDEIPPLLEDILQNLAFDESFNILGNTYTLEAIPSSVQVDDYGINLGLQTNVLTNNWTMSSGGLGSLYGYFSPPSFTSNSSVNISLSLDVINQLLYQAWGGGAISQELSFSSLGIGGNELDLIFPNTTDLQITIDPLLPPVAVPNGSDLELQMGDLYIAIHNGDYSAGDIRMELYAHIFAPLEISASSSSISASVGTPNSYFDVVYPTAGASSAEGLFNELIPLLLPSITDAIGGLELPSFQGFSISSVTTTVNNGQLILTGTLSN
jgi:hypothetical protein